MTKLEAKDGTQKFLVVRRDGTVPAWPWFILGGRDEAAEAALRAYAEKAEELEWDREYIDGIRSRADEFEAYRQVHSYGDPDAEWHRADQDSVIKAMRGKPSTINVRPSNPASEETGWKETDATAPAEPPRTAPSKKPAPLPIKDTKRIGNKVLGGRKKIKRK